MTLLVLTIMRHTIIINSILHLLFVQTIFFAVNKAQNTLYNNATDGKLLNAERLKRSPIVDPPEILTAVIAKKGKSIIHLRWVKTDQLLANKNLPVWAAKSGDIHEEKKQEASGIINSFVMYHDIEQTSAIIYVKDKQAIFGYIDLSYYIDDCQIKNFDEIVLLNVGDSCLKENPEANIHGEHNRHQPSDKNKAINNLSFNHLKPSTSSGNNQIESEDNSNNAIDRLPKIKKYYLETLLFITYDIIEPINFRIYFNLAGIIFEEEKNVFSSRTGASTLSYNKRYNNLELDDVCEKFPSYYKCHSNFKLSCDSFDYIFLSTKRDLVFESERLPGFTILSEDIYHMKFTNNHDMQRHPFSVVRKYPHFSFPIAAHEVGHVLGCDEHDSPFRGKHVNQKQCSSLMQESLPLCYNCLKWSSSAVREIEEYMRKERNRCWLLNFPRSLYQLNEPRVYLLPSEQCKCFGYNSHGEKPNELKVYISSEDCAKPLRCLKVKNNRYKIVPTISPFDGVPCAEGDKQVCWQGQCVDVQNI